MTEKLIIWDWNGTLLNDVEVCVDCMNQMLRKRGMKLLTVEEYKNIFTFPVQDYYKTVGYDFDKESFENLSIEYIDLYKKYSENSPLYHDVVDALQFFKDKNYRQIIVSASEQKALEDQVKQRKIYDYFDAIIGLNNIHAKSKVDNAIAYLQNSSIEFEQISLIGDTYHDYEVAEAINCDCILVNNGHQFLNNISENNDLKIVESIHSVAEVHKNQVIIKD